MNHILIPTSKGTRAVLEDSIIRIEASSNYCKIYFDKGHPLVVAKLLHWFQHNLPATNFFRIHRTHIVNRKYVLEMAAELSAMVLTNGEILQVSRRRKTTAGQFLKRSA
jgi:two-component system LytT family response regulator